MRISNIHQFFDGPNVNAFDYRQGEASNLIVTWTTGTPAVPTNLTGFTIRADTEFMTADVTTTSNRSGGTDIELSNVTPTSTPAARQLVTSITNATGGQFRVQIPSDLYAPTIEPDDTTAVPMAVTYVSVTDAATPATTNKIILVHIIRRAITAG